MGKDGWAESESMGGGSRNNRRHWSPSPSMSTGKSRRVAWGVVYCNCDREAVVKISRTRKNPGRCFYTCPLPMDDERNCNFFEWVDADLMWKFDRLENEMRKLKKCVVAFGVVIISVMSFVLFLLLLK